MRNGPPKGGPLAPGCRVPYGWATRPRVRVAINTVPPSAAASSAEPVAIPKMCQSKPSSVPETVVASGSRSWG